MSLSRTEILPTRQTLLSRLRDCDDHESWRDFFDLYWKLLYNMARKRGLNEQESQEVVQDTVIAVAKTMPEFRYDPKRCSFKSWLRHLLEKKIADQFRRRARANQTVSLDAEESVAWNLADVATLPPDAAWEQEWQQSLLETAIERIKTKVSPQQFQIFHRLVVLNFPAGEVARTLDVNIAQVYLAKHRVVARVKQEIKTLQKQFG